MQIIVRDGERERKSVKEVERSIGFERFKENGKSIKDFIENSNGILKIETRKKKACLYINGT